MPDPYQAGGQADERDECDPKLIAPDTEPLLDGSQPRQRPWLYSPSALSADRPLRLQTKLLAGVSIVAIACAAAFVRYWPLLHGQPGGLYPDEASEGIAALRILNDPWYRPVFIDENGGREALFAYLVAVTIKLAGPTVLAIRATSAFVGLAGIAASWWLLRRFGLVAAIAGITWMAGSPWLIATSELGLRNGLTVPFAGLAAAALLWWSDRPSPRRALLAGLACGAGLWTYQPLKLTPVLIGAWLLWLRRSDRPLFAGL